MGSVRVPRGGVEGRIRAELRRTPTARVMLVEVVVTTVGHCARAGQPAQHSAARATRARSSSWCSGPRPATGSEQCVLSGAARAGKSRDVREDGPQ